jgi:hypothetical protein
LEQFGQGGGVKAFPAWALSASTALRRALLDGYVSADGSAVSAVSGRAIETSTISKGLALSTKALAESLGYVAPVFNAAPNSREIEGRNVDAKPCYRVRWRTEPQRSQTMRDGIHNWARVQNVSAEVEVLDLFIISVEDDGPGLPENQRAEALKRGQRLDESKPGSGLGLSIVTETVEVLLFNIGLCTRGFLDDS